MTIFEIPVYSFTQEKVQKHWDKFYRKQISDKGYDDAQQNEIISKLKSIENSKMIWKYNEIVGYITINIQRMDILAMLYKDMRRRIQIGGKCKISLADPSLFRVRVKKLHSSKQIIDMLKSEINMLQKEHYWLRKRFIYTETFYNICPYINWDQLFKTN